MMLLGAKNMLSRVLIVWILMACAVCYNFVIVDGFVKKQTHAVQKAIRRHPNPIL